MARVISGKRHAQAAFELALEKGELDDWQSSLRKIADITTDEKLMALLENPKLPFNAKKSILDERLREINPLTLNLACLLMYRNRLRIVGDISHHYDRLLNTHYGIEDAEVTTAFPLEDGDKERISGKIGDVIERRVYIDTRIDPSLIGGVKIKIGDTLIDGSIKNNLETLRKNLIEGGR